MEDLKTRWFKAKERAKNATELKESAEKELKDIESEIAHHPQLPMHVSAHAKLRYIFRVYELNEFKITNEMLSLCDECGEPERQPHNGSDQYIYKNPNGPHDSEITFCVKENTITTCYTNEKEDE